MNWKIQLKKKQKIEKVYFKCLEAEEATWEAQRKVMLKVCVTQPSVLISDHKISNRKYSLQLI